MYTKQTSEIKERVLCKELECLHMFGGAWAWRTSLFIVEIDVWSRFACSHIGNECAGVVYLCSVLRSSHPGPNGSCSWVPIPEHLCSTALLSGHDTGIWTYKITINIYYFPNWAFTSNFFLQCYVQAWVYLYFKWIFLRNLLRQNLRRD